ncbi:N-(5'-phosphoribosyl)anthranilate isomerase [Poriferisphaera corsica]|uniref:N-(5'-phosphoribosyl)anthranilate isomerase n=1 Tax=Poriferisphaera corsica TaxID=2528020 RepID=A0A517YSU7_9BACT|nr:phosphoribosylanthranilate isomerase [Poriferisphaera corsica]QDU33306.1 N-(5'-phosphoribosyl)anthranilate isomerase [Poriferisphaera corsica]
MSRTRIKICGIRDEQMANIAAQAGADAIGLVFVEKSPRNIAIDTARQIVQSLPPLVEPIGLFVDEDADHVRHVAEQVGINTVQLHGRESMDDVLALDNLTVLKAVTFSNDPQKLEELIDEWSDPPSHLKALLWDADASDANEGLLGGTGHRFDWDAFAKLIYSGKIDRLPKPILAGGLNPDNVAHAIEIVQPYAVDVSSGVESSRGIKDPDLIVQFCEQSQQAKCD